MSQISENMSAPVVASAEVYISAPVEIVWGVLSDFESWPEWNQGVSKMKMCGELNVGTSFVWEANGSKIRSRLEEMDCPHRLVWSGRTFGVRAVHVWEFQEKEGGTLVTTRESFEGVLASLFKRSLKQKLVKTLNQGVLSLKNEAEACHELLGA